MDEIKWLEIAVNTTPDKLDDVCAKLAAAGMDSLVIEDEQDFLAFLEQNRQYWDYVDQELLDRMRGVTRVKFYVTDDAGGKKQLAQYTQGLEEEFTTTSLTDNDWAYSWQKYYRPLEIGKRLYVVPQWLREEPVPEGRTPFYLNPGLTFGTGSHASTQLCLEGVEEQTLPGRDVLDLGCGSGILSIAALCLGAKSAIAVDIDPKAVDVAYENAALNGIGRDRYTVRAGNVLANRALAAELAQKRYHLVLANIVADVIIPLAPQVPGLLEEDGVFLCSGIIDARAHEVEAALKQAGLTVTQKREKNGWAALEAVRSTP
jgi:ribosomal protein L11 methyltransferase